MGESYPGRDNLAAMRAARRYNEAILRLLLRGVRAPRVLDFGAGDGLFAGLMRERGLSPVCIEPDAQLRALLQAEGFDARASLEAVAPASVDAIVSINVLEHIEEDEQALRALRGKVVPEGTLFVFVPAFPLLYSSMDRLVGHRRRYRKQDMAAKLVRSGWRIESLRYFDSVGFLAALAYRVLGPESGEVSPRSAAAYDRWVFPASRALDPLLGGWVGKNLVALARNA